MEIEEAKEEDESSLDGEFIKVEKESIVPPDVHQKMRREVLESQERAEELEKELLRISTVLKECELKNKTLKDEVMVMKEKHQEAVMKEINDLVEANLKLTQDLAKYEYESSDLQIKLQSQICSVMEENNFLNETYQSSKNDLQTMILHLEEQLEALNSEVAQKAELQNHVNDLQEKLGKAEARFWDEASIIYELKHLFEEHEAKKIEIIHLENEVKELEQRLKEVEGTADEVVRYREIDSTASKRKLTKDPEATSAALSSSDATQVMNLKFILVVALVAVIFGIIIGKRY